MTNSLQKTKVFEENLIDSGCSKSVCATCLDYFEHEQYQHVLTVLKTHRDKQRQKLHKLQHCIDNLDFLIHSLELNCNT